MFKQEILNLTKKDKQKFEIKISLKLKLKLKSKTKKYLINNINNT